MVADPYFKDPEKEAKLQEAIRYGFIIKNPDGKYAITPVGIQRWMYEKTSKSV
jgi:LAS superfamily LD-carboxypeptidase LdcB